MIRRQTITITALIGTVCVSFGYSQAHADDMGCFRALKDIRRNIMKSHIPATSSDIFTAIQRGEYRWEQYVEDDRNSVAVAKKLPECRDPTGDAFLAGHQDGMLDAVQYFGGMIRAFPPIPPGMGNVKE